MSCTLKRCQGKRGCICPKGSVPVGTYAGRTTEKPSAPKLVKNDLPPPRTQQIVKSNITGNTITAKNVPSNSSIMKEEAGNKSNSVAKSSPITELNEKIEPGILPSIDGDGTITIRYNHYKKPFSIISGSTTAAAVDAEYFLSFAFPGAKIHLSLYSPSDFSFEDKGLTSRPLIPEQPIGVFRNLKAGGEYWVDIEEDAKEKEAYEQRQQAIAEANAKKRAIDEELEKSGAALINKVKIESCSCIEGNPCLDRYCCKDWEHRYEVAKKHGWKGFQ